MCMISKKPASLCSHVLPVHPTTSGEQCSDLRGGASINTSSNRPFRPSHPLAPIHTSRKATRGCSGARTKRCDTANVVHSPYRSLLHQSVPKPSARRHSFYRAWREAVFDLYSSFRLLVPDSHARSHNFDPRTPHYPILPSIVQAEG